MNYTITKLNDSKLRIDISLSKEEMDFYFKEGEKELRNQARLSSGKEKNFSSQEVLDRAIKKAIFESFLEITKKENFNLIGAPKAEVKQFLIGGPLSYEVQIEVIPEIKIGDYKKIAKDVFSQRRKIEVSQKEIEDALNFLRNSRAKLKKLENGESVKELPALDDEFAKSLGKFSSLEELKTSMKEGIFQEKLVKEKERLRQKFLEKISENVVVELPQTLVESFAKENFSYFKNFLEKIGKDFESYLKETNQNREDLEEKIKKEAEDQVKQSLILHQIAKIEKIDASEQETTLLAQKIANQKSLNELNEFDKKRLLDYAKERVVFEKVFQFLENQ